MAGLAYNIAMKTPELSGRVQMLKADYDEQYNLAAGEDREKVSERFVPRVGENIMAFASKSRKAIAECDICGFRFKLRELRNIITRVEIQISKHAQSVLVLTTHKTSRGCILCVIPRQYVTHVLILQDIHKVEIMRGVGILLVMDKTTMD